MNSKNEPMGIVSMYNGQLGIVIPFSNPRQCLLDALPKLRLVKEHVLFVRTLDKLQVEEELKDFNFIVVGSELNIQRWWNLGINFFSSRGYAFVMLANDDIDWNLETIEECVKKLRNSNANLGKVLPSNGGQWGHAIFLRILPTSGKVHLFSALSEGAKQVMIFPDQTFRWYFGDGDLEKQHSKTASGKVENLGFDIFHFYPGENTQKQPKLALIAKRDQENYLMKWKMEKFKKTMMYKLLYLVRSTISKIISNLTN